ncbi:hypothetical protein GYMLUDRAFT_88967 [Collybiopsis luxurians FD-317 M1]|uniref:BTB domain-containing protein n=1 Tax=Collybiopsis luxurians FD-317 M1 TaxID=944289 RepID=A0A0D0C9Z3_9AGAR|nr:hypothetical protein GYMLUDRAFT_88967 [Collybiopsis luxurians FD-317 M1]
MAKFKPRFIVFNEKTIFEPNYSEARPRKRARVDDSDEDEPSISRDAIYYDLKLSDADACVIQVEEYLFRVQKSRITGTSLVLDDLLIQAQASDDNPMEIETRPEHFRAFLWALHALPDELELPIEQVPQLEKFCSIAKFACSFICSDQKRRALAALHEAVGREFFFGTCSSSSLNLLVETAVTCSDDVLLDCIVAKWIERIQRRESACVPAIKTAHSLLITRLFGAACYVYLQELAEQSTTESDEGPTWLNFDPKLDTTQRASILAGYWSLVNYWERFRHRPLKFVSCEHDSCHEIWMREWFAALGSSRVLGTSQSDVVRLVRIMREVLMQDNEVKFMPGKCREKVLKELGKAGEELNEKLGDHFAALL